ncbi:hypothetical protein [Chryseosolibacter indicus]|uniref:Uncharacterized protein n=1 Tax=Chryseosolibacter indicus TaxID=2782351 RepID=A0ABS5VPH9_9BACT|nr:hypothetical protein [Chryseosolibacter indicus]MBT1703350.1 hypothetical protein [Chryseosolibacter indicus]
MKKLFNYCLLLLFIWTTVRCQSTDSITRIEYTTLTRGFQKQVRITPDSVVSITEGRGDVNGRIEHRITDSEWKTLRQKLEGVELDEIPALLSPTSKRAYDGARHSTLIITDDKGKTWQHSFDDEVPNDKLKPLLEALLSLDNHN